MNKFELIELEINSRFFSIFKYLQLLLLPLSYFYFTITINIVILILIVIIAEVFSSKNKRSTLVLRENSKIIGFINGYKNYINKLMVLPGYQKKGYGKLLLMKYISKFCKGSSKLHFKTSPLLDSFYILMLKDDVESIVKTDNLLTYEVTTPIDSVFY